MQNTRQTFTCLIVSLFGIIGVWLTLPSLYAQTPPNTITLENESGDFALVQVIGPTERLIEVPQGQKRTVNVTAGEYYLLARYGESPERYRYTKGESFKVTQTATQYSTITITLHKVAGGNYPTQPTSQEEFEKALSSLRPENELNSPDKNDIRQSSYFDPAKGKGLVFIRYANEGFPFRVKDTQHTGYLVLHFLDQNTRAGLLPALIINEFFNVEGKNLLFSIGRIKIDHIKEIEILEEYRNYSVKYPNDRFITLNPYFKARIMLQDNSIYIALVSSFDLVEDQKEPLKFVDEVMVVGKDATIHKIKQGMTVVRIAN
jgi:hypothetical protein